MVQKLFLCIHFYTAQKMQTEAFPIHKLPTARNAPPCLNCPVSSCPADAQVQDFLLHSQSDMSNTSQGMWLQQTCTLFIQSGVQLLTEFTQHAAVWANTSVVRANFSQLNHTRSQLERTGNHHGKQDSCSKKVGAPKISIFRLKMIKLACVIWQHSLTAVKYSQNL